MRLQSIKFFLTVTLCVVILLLASVSFVDHTSLFAWLLAPLDPLRPHAVNVLNSWHARFMVVAWSIIFPIGILAARFFKITPRQDWPRVKDNSAWWKIHLYCQWGGIFVVCIGMLFIFQDEGRASIVAAMHRYLGCFTLGLIAVQVLGGALRGTKGGPAKPAADGSWFGDHYNMTMRRRFFEYAHKSTGYVAFIVSILVTMLGFWEVNAPRWLWIILPIWWVALAAIFAYLQHRKMARDTYEAIWGPDSSHPGNLMKPIGWGITRSSQHFDGNMNNTKE